MYPNLPVAASSGGEILPATSVGLVPGALDLTADFHPVKEDGSVDTRVTALGTPAEGVWFFQQSAARPRANSYVLNNVARWATAVVKSLAEAERESA